MKEKLSFKMFILLELIEKCFQHIVKIAFLLFTLLLYWSIVDLKLPSKVTQLYTYIYSFFVCFLYSAIMGFPGVTRGKESSCQCRRLREADSIPGSKRSTGVGNCTLLQYSCLENPMDRGTRWATVHRTTKSQKWLSVHKHHYGLSQEIGYTFPVLYSKAWLYTYSIFFIFYFIF